MGSLSVTRGQKVEVAFRIKKDGTVEMSVQGSPGSSCLDVAQAFDILGERLDARRTPEFYEERAAREVRTRLKGR
ncbi:MAG: DUF2997 domain-containing protein [Acidobacteriota bacterium]